MERILSAENISAGYQDRPVLQDVSVYVDKGEKVLLIGPNGCGKSTLLKVLAGVLRPWKGCVRLKETEVSHVLGDRRIRLGMGYLMQSRNIFPSLTVEENLQLSFWDTEGNYRERRDWLLTVFPMLKDKLSYRAGLLSGGERQALAISLVLMRPVDLLLLDEPTAGLSPKAAAMILEAVHEAQAVARFAAIIVEHNLRLVHEWVSRVLIMNQGRIVAEESEPSRLLDHDTLQRFYFR